MRKEREKEYSLILDSLQKIRGAIVAESEQELMFTGIMPAEAREELKLIADITAVIFNGLAGSGIPISSSESNPSLAVMKVGEKEYSTLKSQLNVELKTNINTQVVTEEKKPMEVTEPAEVIESVRVEEPVYEEEKPVNEPVDRSINDYLPQDQIYHPIEEKTEEESNGEPDIVESYIDESVKETPFFVPEPIEKTSEDKEPGGSGVINFAEDDSSSVPDEDIVPAPVVTGKAKIIGGDPVAISGLDKSEFFIDEQSKVESEFVYCFSKISVMHTDMGGGGKPEEMLVLIAPLKIYKYASTSVPIVVTIVHNGKSVTASSYDILEEGKNIVTIDIDEFYFLCRGSFDDKGKFKASIVTTGISSQQNDHITPLFSKTYGNSTLKETRNGHIKFHYTADSGPGSIEVIPFGVQGDRSEDFIAIVKNKEFVDYYLVSKSLKASARAIVYSEGGVMNELVCHWEDDTLIADLV